MIKGDVMETEFSAILYEEMIENMQEGILMLNAKGIVIRMNDAAMKLLHADEQVINMPYALFMSENEENDAFHELVLSTIFEKKKVRGQIVKLANHEKDNKEEELWVSVSVSYLNTEAGKAVVVVLEDLTGINELRDARIALNKIRLLNEELEEAKNAAIEANEAKSRFISSVSHEIRTPINAVLGMNEMVLRESKDSQILEYAMNIQNAGKTLHFLINDILDMSKLEAGRMELTEGEYELKQLLQELWGLIYLRAQEKGLALSFVIEESTPRRLYGDDIRIKQIITNILTNAVKYTPKGSVQLRLQFQKNESDEDMIDLIVAVEDTGIGIKEEDKQAVFESFKRVDSQVNKHIEGTGLGMNITMSLLELMNGRLELESEYQKGSTFTVIIPQRVIDKEPIGEIDMEKTSFAGRSEDDDKTTLYAPQAKVLVVDDNMMNLEVAKGLLKRTGIQIMTAESGFKAIEKVKESVFDLIFMDHQMPKMDGIETLDELRKLNEFEKEKTKIVMLTANAVSGLMQTYKEKGFDDVLTKPIEPKKLEEVLKKLLPNELQRNEMPEQNINEQLQDCVASEVQKELLESEIDLQSGLSHMNEDMHAYEKVAQVFVYQATETMEKLKELLQKKDLANYKIFVHGLKGNAATLGAAKLAEIAFEHETAAKKEDADYLIQHMDSLEVQVKKTITAFQRFCVEEKKEEGDAVWETVQNWILILQDIRQKLEAFETEQAIVLLNNILNDKSWKCWEKELHRVKDAIVNEYDEDKAITLLNHLMEGEE